MDHKLNIMEVALVHEVEQSLGQFKVEGCSRVHGPNVSAAVVQLALHVLDQKFHGFSVSVFLLMIRRVAKYPANASLN
jgi:hypothetical protein